MSNASFYTDRTRGPVARSHEELPAKTSAGLLALIHQKVDGHWLAAEFPAECPDGGAVAGTDHNALSANLSALIPDVEWPLPTDGAALADASLFDVVEYVAGRIALPVKQRYHSYWGHNDLAFDIDGGVEKYREEVNQIFRRGGTVYELNGDLQVVRHGAPEVESVLAELRSATGDKHLDSLIEQARSLYVSRDGNDRAFAIEKLWDAFERLKTLDDRSDKKRSVTALLGHIPDAHLRSVVEAEMRALTDFGNSFTIRHHEAGKTPVPTDAGDYIAGRMANLLVFLLGQSGRL